MIDRVNVNGPQFYPTRPGGAGDANSVPAVNNSQEQQVARNTADRRDSVELSAEARALASSDAGRAENSLSPERLQGIVQRLETGFYNSDGAVTKIAEGVLNDLNAG